MTPAVSIIIPAFRAEAFIARSINSVLAQSVQDFEIVIASDDGQDYAIVLRAQDIEDGRLRFVTTGGIGTGAAQARNAAMRAARSRMIAVLDADDAFMRFHLERMLPLAARHGIAISQVEYADHDTEQPLPNRAKPFATGMLPLEDMLLACLHTYSPIVFDSARLHHLWNEWIPLLEDTVFLAQCYNALPAVWYEAEPSYRYYRRGDSVCNGANAAQRFLEAGRVITGLLDNGDIPAAPHVAKVLRAYIRRNDALEHAFEQALAEGRVSDYQDFIGQNMALLHAPLIIPSPWKGED